MAHPQPRTEGDGGVAGSPPRLPACLPAWSVWGRPYTGLLALFVPQSEWFQNQSSSELNRDHSGR